MKRIKVMLTAIAVFAVVGGALAFKANKNSFVYCTDLQHAGAQAGIDCPRVQSTFVLDEVDPNSYCTTTLKNEAQGETGICDITAKAQFLQ